MSNSPKRAFGSSAKTKRKDLNLDLNTAQKMLPLVAVIVRDIVEKQRALVKLSPEQDSLDRHRHDLVWQERERRYHIHEEVEAAQKALKEAVGELSELGLDLIDESTGCVAFPTKINGRSAVFSWQPGEDLVQYWSYLEEDVRRPIPKDWQSGTPIRLKSKP